MKKLITWLAITLLSTSAHALPILVGPADWPTGVNSLVVDGVNYDVTFSLSADPDQSSAPSLNSSHAATALADFLGTQTISSWALESNEITYFPAYELFIWLDFRQDMLWDIFGGNGVSATYSWGGCAYCNPNSYYDYWTVRKNDEFDLNPAILGFVRQSNHGFPSFFGTHNALGLTNVSASFRAVDVDVPEPGTLALLGLGLAGLGFARRKTKV